MDVERVAQVGNRRIGLSEGQIQERLVYLAKHQTGERPVGTDRRHHQNESDGHEVSKEDFLLEIELDHGPEGPTR